MFFKYANKIKKRFLKNNDLNVYRVLVINFSDCIDSRMNTYVGACGVLIVGGILVCVKTKNYINSDDRGIYDTQEYFSTFQASHRNLCGAGYVRRPFSNTV